MNTDVPAILALYATPTPHTLLAAAAISPAHLVPWWFFSENIQSDLVIEGIKYRPKGARDNWTKL